MRYNTTIMKKSLLTQLKTRQKGRIVEVAAGHTLQHRLMSMGMYPGREVTMISQFVMKGPVAVRVGRSVIALGWGTAHKITVEVE